MSRTVRLDLPVAADVLYGYLTDLRRRPEWQASLRRVDDLHGSGGLGSSWIDVTAVGARPAMRVTAAEPTRLWVEQGRWRGLVAELRLDLLGYALQRTRLTATFSIAGAGLYRLPAAVLERLAAPAIKADLRRGGERATQA